MTKHILTFTFLGLAMAAFLTGCGLPEQAEPPKSQDATKLLVDLAKDKEAKKIDVYVVQGDKRFHKQDCTEIGGKETRSMKKMRAMVEGAVQCDVCKP